jgi:hypothetical protein
MAGAISLGEVLDGHVALDVTCLDRVYLNAYVPNLQVPGQVGIFCTRHLGKPIPSPAVFQPLGDRFRREVKKYAERNDIPILKLKAPDRSVDGDRKVDHVEPLARAAARQGRFGVVAIVTAQEVQKVWMGRPRARDHAQFFEFYKADRAVTVFYFYVLDPDFGLGFIKICTYFPYPAKVWVNGHEWAKRQADHEGLVYTALGNGFESCPDLPRLQAICDRLTAADIQGFFDRWIAQVPTPLGRADRDAGYWWELSMRQVEVSRTLVFDAPRRARGFFEALLGDNIEMGRPDHATVIWGRQIRKNTPGQFATRVLTRGVETKIDFTYKNSRVKEYLKEGKAMRIETVINSPTDFDVKRRLEHLDELQAKGRGVNDRLLAQQRAGQDCAIDSPLFERMSLPYNHEGALCVYVHTVTGFTNRSLRALVAGLLGHDYTASQMTYDLRRLQLHGLIERLPRTNRYRLTPDGVRVAAFYTKVHHRILGPLLAPDQPPAPPELRRAMKVIDQTIDDYLNQAQLGLKTAA